MRRKKSRFETSKVLIVFDYLILLALITCIFVFPDCAELSAIVIAWIAQLGCSCGFYYWKAKNENRVKIPINTIKTLPKDVVDKIDLTQIIISIIQSE